MKTYSKEALKTLGVAVNVHLTCLLDEDVKHRTVGLGELSTISSDQLIREIWKKELLELNLIVLQADSLLGMSRAATWLELARKRWMLAAEAKSMKMYTSEFPLMPAMVEYVAIVATKMLKMTQPFFSVFHDELVPKKIRAICMGCGYVEPFPVVWSGKEDQTVDRYETGTADFKCPACLPRVQAMGGTGLSLMLMVDKVLPFPIAYAEMSQEQFLDEYMDGIMHHPLEVGTGSGLSSLAFLPIHGSPDCSAAHGVQREHNKAKTIWTVTKIKGWDNYWVSTGTKATEFGDSACFLTVRPFTRHTVVELSPKELDRLHLTGSALTNYHDKRFN